MRILGFILAFAVSGSGQEPQLSETRSAPLKVSGQLQGQTELKAGEGIAILLKPGYSNTLNSEIAAGAGPVVLLTSGRTAQVLPPQSTNLVVGGTLGGFEFQNVLPGEYQLVAVTFVDGMDYGAAIAEGPRIVVVNQNVTELQLTIGAPPAGPPGPQAPPLRGGAATREATVLDPEAETVIAPPLRGIPPRGFGGVPTGGPINRGGGVPARTGVLKEIFGVLVFGAGAFILGWLFTR